MQFSLAYFRYPYVSGLAAHFCPLPRWGSSARGSKSPFVATVEEDGGEATATLTSATGQVAKVSFCASSPRVNVAVHEHIHTDIDSGLTRGERGRVLQMQEREALSIHVT